MVIRLVEGDPCEIDFGQFTQPMPDRDRSYWRRLAAAAHPAERARE